MDATPNRNRHAFQVIVPIVRRADSFHEIQQVIAANSQGRAIVKVIYLSHNYAVSRASESPAGRMPWFLERMRSYAPQQWRDVTQGAHVGYHFEINEATVADAAVNVGSCAPKD